MPKREQERENIIHITDKNIQLITDSIDVDDVHDEQELENRSLLPYRYGDLLPTVIKVVNNRLREDFEEKDIQILTKKEKELLERNREFYKKAYILGRFQVINKLLTDQEVSFRDRIFDVAKDKIGHREIEAIRTYRMSNPDQNESEWKLKIFGKDVDAVEDLYTDFEDHDEPLDGVSNIDSDAWLADEMIRVGIEQMEALYKQVDSMNNRINEVIEKDKPDIYSQSQVVTYIPSVQELFALIQKKHGTADKKSDADTVPERTKKYFQDVDLDAIEEIEIHLQKAEEALSSVEHIQELFKRIRLVRSINNTDRVYGGTIKEQAPQIDREKYENAFLVKLITQENPFSEEWFVREPKVSIGEVTGAYRLYGAYIKDADTQDKKQEKTVEFISFIINLHKDQLKVAFSNGSIDHDIGMEYIARLMYQRLLDFPGRQEVEVLIDNPQDRHAWSMLQAQYNILRPELNKSASQSPEKKDEIALRNAINIFLYQSVEMKRSNFLSQREIEKFNGESLERKNAVIHTFFTDPKFRTEFKKSEKSFEEGVRRVCKLVGLEYTYGVVSHKRKGQFMVGNNGFINHGDAIPLGQTVIKELASGVISGNEQVINVVEDMVWKSAMTEYLKKSDALIDHDELYQFVKNVFPANFQAANAMKLYTQPEDREKLEAILKIDEIAQKVIQLSMRKWFVQDTGPNWHNMTLTSTINSTIQSYLITRLYFPMGTKTKIEKMIREKAHELVEPFLDDFIWTEFVSGSSMTGIKIDNDLREKKRFREEQPKTEGLLTLETTALAYALAENRFRRAKEAFLKIHFISKGPKATQIEYEYNAAMDEFNVAQTVYDQVRRSAQVQAGEYEKVTRLKDQRLRDRKGKYKEYQANKKSFLLKRFSASIT